MSDPTEIARATIIDLLAKGVIEATKVEQEEHPAAVQLHFRRANGFLIAANSILSAFPELYNELIEHEDFFVLRRIQRTYGPL